MRPAPLLGLLLWAPLLWAPPPPVRDPRHRVHWNGSNPRFLRDDYTIQVAINDYLDIYCPHYEGAVPAGRAETFTLFMVDQEGYRGCYETPGAFKRWECNRPQSPFGPVRFSEKIQRFTPFSLGFEFQPGETYYYISVPSPESAGRCLKLRVSVCCKSTTPEPVTEVPNSQPRGRGGPEDAVPAQGIVAPLQPHTPCLTLPPPPSPLRQARGAAPGHNSPTGPPQSRAGARSSGLEGTSLPASIAAHRPRRPPCPSAGLPTARRTPALPQGHHLISCLPPWTPHPRGLGTPQALEWGGRRPAPAAALSSGEDTPICLICLLGRRPPPPCRHRPLRFGFNPW